MQSSQYFCKKSTKILVEALNSNLCRRNSIMNKWYNLLFVILLCGINFPTAYALPSQADINNYKKMEYEACNKQCYANRESCFAQSKNLARNRAEWQSMDIACFQQNNACVSQCQLILRRPY